MPQKFRRIGIVCAMCFEAACVVGKKPVVRQVLAINERSVMIVSGMGINAAAQGARQLVAAGADCLVSFGCGGALVAALRPGNLVQPDKVYAPDREYAPQASLPAPARQRLSRAGLVLRVGPLLCRDRLLVDAAAKREAHSTTGAVAVDMESAGILAVAGDCSLPAIVLRVIVDSVAQTVPPSIRRNIDCFGRVRHLGLTAALVRAPAQIPALVRLGEANVRAARAMKLVARELVGEVAG